MGVSGGPPARKAMLTNPAQLRKYVQRCMRKLLEKGLMTVSIVHFPGLGGGRGSRMRIWGERGANKAVARESG